MRAPERAAWASASWPIRPPSMPSSRRCPPGSTVLRFAPDEAFVVGAGSTRVDDPHAIIEDEVGFVALAVDRDVVARHSEWALPAEPARSPRARSPACPAKLAWLPDGRAWVVTHAAYAAELAGSPAMSEYTPTLPPIRWADEPKPAYDVVIIGGGGHGLSTAYHLATRHGITNVAVLEADYIAQRQHRPEHDDHPGQLRHPRGDPLLPALARALPGARGRDRRGDPPPDQGHRLAGPHRDGDAHRARPGGDEPGLRRADVHAHARRSSRSSSRSST